MRLLLAAALIALSALFAGAGTCLADEKWPGVDEAVVERFAEENGRPASCPLVNIEGDALLFAFLVGGAAGGFALGYFYRDFAARCGCGEGKKGEGTDAG